MTWNLQWFPSGTPKLAAPEVEAERIRAVAKTIRILNPDVLLLQEVRNQAACLALAEELKPAEYHTLVCSSFSDGVGRAPGGQQVAILSKVPGDAAWAEKWKSEGTVDPPRGFAFALIPIGGKRFAFYSLHLKSNLLKGDREREEQVNILKREISAERLIEHSDAVVKEHGNVAGVIVAGDFNTNPDDSKFVSEQTLLRFDKSGFSNPVLKLSMKERITWPSDGRYPDATFDYLFIRGASAIGKPEITESAVSDHRSVTVEVRIP